MRSAYRHLRFARIFCLAAFCVATAAAASAEDVHAILRKASDNRHWNKLDLAIQFCDEVLAHPEADDQRKIEAYSVLLDVHRRRRDQAAVERTARRLRDSFPKNTNADITAFLNLGDYYRDIGELPLAVAMYRELAAAQSEDANAYTHAQGGVGELLLRMKRYAQSYHEASKSAAREFHDTGRTAWALQMMVEASWLGEHYKDCVSATKRLLEPKYLRYRDIREHPEYYWRYAESMRASGQFTLKQARDYLRDKAREVKDQKLAQGLVLKIARRCFDDGDFPKAADAYNEAITAHPTVTDFWYDAQRGLAESLVRKGDIVEGIKAMRICLDDGDQSIWKNVLTIAELFRELDGNVDRANALVNYQSLGPAGADKKLNTADDLKDPLAAIGYPNYQERERAFEKAMPLVGDDAWASHHRAMMYTYLGKPDKALPYYMDSFARCTYDNYLRLGELLVYRGLRPTIGHAVGLETAYWYVARGKNGKDGAAGTADDLPDPFPQPRPRVSRFHSNEEIAALQQVRDFTMQVAEDGTKHRDERVQAIYALQRIYEAIGTFGDSKLVGWATELMLREFDERVHEALVTLAQDAAKDNALHLQGVYALWTDLDAAHKKVGRGYQGSTENRKRHFNDMAGRLDQYGNVAPGIWHLRAGDKRSEAFRPAEKQVVVGPAEPDLTPPSAPTGFKAAAVGYRWLEISWTASSDPESEIALYEIYRGEDLLTRTKDASYREEGLVEGSPYSYSVRALSNIGLYSSLSDAFVARTNVDTTAPTIAKIESAGTPTRVVVTFSEPVETGADTAANYRIAPTVAVFAAALSADKLSVELVTSALVEGTKYMLTASGISDTARNPNRIKPKPTSFEYEDVGTGLKAIYFDEMDFKGKTFERIDECISFPFNQPEVAPGIQRTDFTVRWIGKVRPGLTAEYSFIARTDDGVRLWVDGKQIVDAWVHRGATDSVGKIKLEANRLYDIKMEFFQGGGGASAELFWSAEGLNREIIPKEHLYP